MYMYIYIYICIYIYIYTLKKGPLNITYFLTDLPLVIYLRD